MLVCNGKAPSAIFVPAGTSAEIKAVQPWKAFVSIRRSATGKWIAFSAVHPQNESLSTT